MGLALSSPIGQGRLTKTISITLLVGVLAYGFMVLGWSDWTAIGALMSGLTWAVWIPLLALSMLSLAMRFARWHILISTLGHQMPMGRHGLIYLSAFSLALTPAKIGETIRSFYLHPWGVGYHHSVAAFLTERIIDLLVVMALASLLLFQFKQHGAWIGSVAILVVSAVALIRSPLLERLTRRWLKSTPLTYVALGTQAMKHLLSAYTLIKVAPLTAIAWSAQGLGLCVVAQALGHEMPWYLGIAIYNLGLLAGAASFIPGGLGATEVAMVLLLMAIGLDLSTATTSAVVARGVPLWSAIGLGVLSLGWVARSDQPASSPP